MEEKIIAQINNLIANSESSTFSLLSKASQLAEITGNRDYKLLFDYHIRGINKSETETLSKTNPKVLSMFSTDRMKTGETFYLLGSIVSLESSIKHYEEDIKNAILDLERIKASEPLYPSTIHEVKKQSATSRVGTLRTHESKVKDIVLNIRSRVAKFVNLREIQLLKKSEYRKAMGDNIFIGHGRSNSWRDLKDFLQDRLNLKWDEYNREPTAGMAIKERLEQMLDEACFAFLVMTAEDEHADNLLHARENVTHEVGLFQGRLGFRKAIVLLEEGCQEFSNIHGLSQIRFPKGNIMAKSEEIRRVLEREGILENY